jgi:hypothetical protein
MSSLQQAGGGADAGVQQQQQHGGAPPNPKRPKKDKAEFMNITEPKPVVNLKPAVERVLKSAVDLDNIPKALRPSSGFMSDHLCVSRRGSCLRFCPLAFLSFFSLFPDRLIFSASFSVLYFSPLAAFSINAQVQGCR